MLCYYLDSEEWHMNNEPELIPNFLYLPEK